MRETGSSTTPHNPNRNTITLEGSQEECDMIRRMLTGALWLKMGQFEKLETKEAYHEIFQQDDDPLTIPKWLIAYNSNPPLKYEFALGPEMADANGWRTPGYYLMHLGAGDHKRDYKRDSLYAQRCGFECLRSRRGQDGRIWEVWYLAGKWRAQGPLKEYLDERAPKDRSMTWQEEIHHVTDFAIKYLRFGTFDAVVQRAALCCPD